MATIRAIEDGYRSAGVEVKITKKANDIREFTLGCELIQNHIKWFYLNILPTLEKLLNQESEENHALKASYFSNTITKALAIFAGQWPHSSYAVPGGVTCDPTYVDVLQAETLLDESIQFFEKVMIGMKLEAYLALDSCGSLREVDGDFGKALHLMGISGMTEVGQSHDRFIVFGECLFWKTGKALPTKVSNVNTRFVEEALQEGTKAKAVFYKNRLYEVGPLSRAMVNKEPLVKSLHKRYKDSLLTRVFARVHEVAQLLQYNKILLKELDLNEPSCLLDASLLLDEFEGIGVVEAARGSLIHKIKVSKGIIEKYEIIVPTQWNLSHGTKEEQGIAIKAMVGSKSIEEASFIFRTFDVCSVCTTQ
jgi:Ni,Fe-hydrogenase I large subunit